MPSNIMASLDGPRLTVAAAVKQSKVIPALVLDMMNQQYLTDIILRDAGTTESGSVLYFQSTPLFPNDTSQIVAEFGEIPVTLGQIGNPLVARTYKRALGMVVSYESERRNNWDQVATSMRQIRNGLTRDWNAYFLAGLLAAVPTLQSSSHTIAGGWASGDNTTLNAQYVRKDLAVATKSIALADSDTVSPLPYTGTNKFGFVADTMIIHPNEAQSLMTSREFQALFLGDTAGESALLAETPVQRLPKRILGLNTFVSWQMTAGQALVLQSKVIGGIVDEVPLQATPMRDDQDHQYFRSNVYRQSATFIDQPRAGVLITNVDGT
jgi:hypothetical protein